MRRIIINRIIFLIVLTLIVTDCLVCKAVEDYNSCLAANKYENPTSYDSDLFNEIINEEKKITYECFGAVGDGVTNDYAAIKAAHDFANNIYANEDILLTVFGTKGKTYYIGIAPETIDIYTHTDWKSANFIIDDVVENYSNVDTTIPVFSITSPFKSTGSLYKEYTGSNDTIVKKFSSFGKSSTNLKSVVTAVLADTSLTAKQKSYFQSATKWDMQISCSSEKVYIRSGSNGTTGDPKRENLIVDRASGDILPPITWDYNGCIDNVQIWPVLDAAISVKNATFTTYTENRVGNPSDDGTSCGGRKYRHRNIAIQYTGNVLLSGITHFLDEEKHPYTNRCQTNPKANMYLGFIRLDNASNIKLNDLGLSAHTCQVTADNQQSSYDIVLYNSVNVVMTGVTYACKGEKDADGNCLDESSHYENMRNWERWGVIATNENKNVRIVNSKMNRMDAHRGIHNAAVVDSSIGCRGLRLTGHGYFYGNNIDFDYTTGIVQLRGDYGSTWDGDVLIADSTLTYPDSDTEVYLAYSGNPPKVNNERTNWDYGYYSYFPNVYFNNFTINMKNQKSSSKLYLLNLSDVASTVPDNDRMKYYFKSQANFNNIVYTNGTNCQTYLFKDSFASKTANLNKNNYGGTNKYAISYDSTSNVTNIPTSSYNSNLTNTSINTKFTINSNVSTTSTVNSLKTTMSNYFKDIGTYNLKFHSNGGRDCSITSIHKFKGNIWGRLCDAKRTGYTLKEWNTASDGSGDVVTSNTIVNATIDVYAQWNANTYTVKFNSNGGTGSINNESFTYDQSKKLTKNTFTRENYTFAGWNTKSDGSGTSYTDEQNVSNLTSVNNGTVTLYAQWKINEEEENFEVIEYAVDEENKYIENVKSNTTLNAYQGHFILPTGYTLSINLGDKSYIYTGSVTKILLNGVEKYSFTNVIRGDINGDGVINSGDLLKERQHLLEIVTLQNAFFKAGDINQDNQINSGDLLKIRQHLLGISLIS